MAKSDTLDLMGEFLEGPTKTPQTTHENTTETPRKTHRRPTKTPQKEALQKYHIRLHEGDWNRLKDHFESKGLPVSSGIRMIIREYLDREGV